MKIVYVIDALHTESAGTEGQLKVLIAGMLGRGHNVELYVLRHTEFSRHCQFPCPIRAVGFDSFFSPISWWKAWRFRRYLLRNNFDSLHGFFNDVALLIPILLSFSPLRRFTSRRDMGIWYTQANLAILRFNARSDTQVICNSHAVLEHTQQAENISPAKLYCVYNAVSKTETNNAGEHSAAAKLTSELAKSQATKVCLVANIKPLKQIETLIDAASLIAASSTAAIDYYIVGTIADPVYTEQLRAQIASSSLDQRFHFPGAVPNVRNILSDFDIGVLTSDSEGLSNTIIEYLSAGLATIASKTGGNPEVIQHGENGYLFERGNARQLADQIIELASEESIRIRLSRQAKTSANRFSVAIMLERYEAIYSAGD